MSLVLRHQGEVCNGGAAALSSFKINPPHGVQTLVVMVLRLEGRWNGEAAEAKSLRRDGVAELRQVTGWLMG